MVATPQEARYSRVLLSDRKQHAHLYVSLIGSNMVPGGNNILTFRSL